MDGGEEEDKEYAAPRRVNVRRKQEEKGFSRLPQGVSFPSVAPPAHLGERGTGWVRMKRRNTQVVHTVEGQPWSHIGGCLGAEPLVPRSCFSGA